MQLGKVVPFDDDEIVVLGHPHKITGNILDLEKNPHPDIFPNDRFIYPSIFLVDWRQSKDGKFLARVLPTGRLFEYISSGGSTSGILPSRLLWGKGKHFAFDQVTVVGKAFLTRGDKPEFDSDKMRHGTIVRADFDLTDEDESLLVGVLLGGPLKPVTTRT